MDYIVGVNTLFLARSTRTRALWTPDGNAEILTGMGDIGHSEDAMVDMRPVNSSHVTGLRATRNYHREVQLF